MKKKNQMFFLYAGTFVVAGCSLLYELLIAQTISFLAANTVVWYSLTVGLYLGAMGCGALFSKRIGRQRQPWLVLYDVEILLCVVGGLAVGIIYFAHLLWAVLLLKGAFVFGMTVFFLAAFLMVAAIGFLTGLELPLLIRIGNDVTSPQRVTNRVLSIDYFGSLVGAVSFPLLLVPHLELIAIGLFVAFLNLIVAGTIFFTFVRRKDRSWGRRAAGIVLLGIFILAFGQMKNIQQYFLKKYYYYPESARNVKAFFAPVHDFPEVERYSSYYQKMDIVQIPFYTDIFFPALINAYSTKMSEDPDFPQNYFLEINGDYQFRSDIEEVYHEYFGHVPIILNGRVPQKVLVLGGGDGLLIRELVKYPQIKSITHVELDRKVVELARQHPILTHCNNNSLKDPRVRTIIRDAFHFLKNNTTTYDAIYIDFPLARDYNLSKLYSREFYSFVRKSLAADGFAVLDAPGIDLLTSQENQTVLAKTNDWSVYYNTLAAAGFETIVPYISYLEPNNPQAITVLSQLLADEPKLTKVEVDARPGKRTTEIEDKETMIADLIQQYTADMENGFIMVKAAPEKLNKGYKDFGIKLHVLNELRFLLAFDLDSLFVRAKDARKINSILRPTLPAAASLFEEAKMPY